MRKRCCVEAGGLTAAGDLLVVPDLSMGSGRAAGALFAVVAGLTFVRGLLRIGATGAAVLGGGDGEGSDGDGDGGV